MAERLHVTTSTLLPSVKHSPRKNSWKKSALAIPFFRIGKDREERRKVGVGFAAKTSIVESWQFQSKGLNARLMTLSLQLAPFRFATIISTYAHATTDTDETKEQFYDDLNDVIFSIQRGNKIILMGEFNACVGTDAAAWSHGLGRHGVGKEISNGTLLLSFCGYHQLVPTKIIFQQPNQLQTTWMHPCSKDWHLIDYNIVRQSDRCIVRITKVIRGTETWLDHRPVKKLNIGALIHQPTLVQLQATSDSGFDENPPPEDSGKESVESTSKQLKDL